MGNAKKFVRSVITKLADLESEFLEEIGLDAAANNDNATTEAGDASAAEEGEGGGSTAADKGRGAEGRGDASSTGEDGGGGGGGEDGGAKSGEGGNSGGGGGGGGDDEGGEGGNSNSSGSSGSGRKGNRSLEQMQKEHVIEEIDNFIRERIVAAGRLIAGLAVEKIRDGDVVLTYGRSSVVEQLLLRAHGVRRQFHVVVVDARPTLEGQGLLERLTAAGISCTYVLLNALSYVMVNVTKVFLGAAAISSNGAVYSRVGTAAVAMTAKSRNVPVIFCCETYKLCEKVFLDSVVSNELGDPSALAPPHRQKSTGERSGDNTDNGGGGNGGLGGGGVKYLNLMYDVTPIKFVGMVVTEVGMIPPTAIPALLREYSREAGGGPMQQSDM